MLREQLFIFYMVLLTCNISEMIIMITNYALLMIDLMNQYSMLREFFSGGTLNVNFFYLWEKIENTIRKCF
jgi:hypothetical protein